MHEEISIPELTEVVARLSALLGPRQGGVLPLEGGITNRNFRVNFGGDDYVVRLPGKDTNLLGIDREAERLATKCAAGLGLGPKVAAMLESPSCLVTCFIKSREMTAPELREPEAIDDDRRRPASVPRERPRAAHGFLRPRDRARLRRGVALTRRGAAAGLRGGPGRRGRGGEGGARPPRARAACPVTTTCSPPTSCTTASAS